MMHVKSNCRGLGVTTYKIRKKYSFKEFIAANHDVDAWLRTKTGFRFRRVCLRDDGYVVDIVGWETAREGRSHGGKVLSELPDSLVHTIIDQKTVSWDVMDIAHFVDPEGGNKA